MKTTLHILLLALVALPLTNTFAQKVKIGHDKETDFSKFKTYTWAEPAMPPVRPMLFETLMGRVETELQQKGLTRVDRDGDLTVIPAGGIGFGFAGEAATPYSPTYGGPPPVLNATMWIGTTGSSTAGVSVAEGTLTLTFVDRASNKIVWYGSVRQKLDIERKNKSIELANKAVIKLLKEFPSKK